MTSRLKPRQLATGGTRVADSVPVYHNSGPTPNNAYRTGAVGVQVDISGVFIVSSLLEAAKLRLLVAACSAGGFGARIHPVLIHAAACSAGSSRGRKRWPVVRGSAIRSTRKERQSWRSRS